MIKYILTSTEFQGELVFKFDLKGNLIGFDMEGAQLSHEQHQGLLKGLPRNTSNLLLWTKTKDHLKAVMIPLDLSFECFYKKYAFTHGNKKKAQANWEKLDD